MLMLIANWGPPCQLQFELGALLIPDLVIRYPAVKLNESVSVYKPARQLPLGQRSVSDNIQTFLS